MQTAPPTRPDLAPAPPAPKKRSKWSIAGAVIVGLLVLGGISNLVDDDPTPGRAPVDVTIDEPTGFEVTADVVVDTMPTSQVVQFCTYYAQLGDAAGYAAFADGYGTMQDPNAREVFDELVSRC